MFKALMIGALLAGAQAQAGDMAKDMDHGKEGMAMEKEKMAEFGGHCPVALAMGNGMMGDAKFASTYKGKTYYCVNADTKAVFDKDPKGTLKKAKKAWSKMQKGMKKDAMKEKM